MQPNYKKPKKNFNHRHCQVYFLYKVKPHNLLNGNVISPENLTVLENFHIIASIQSETTQQEKCDSKMLKSHHTETVCIKHMK